MTKPIRKGKRSWENHCDVTIKTPHDRNYHERPTLTAKRARTILDAAKAVGLHGQSVINKTLTKTQAYDILSKGIPQEGVLSWLTARNIVREFRKQAKRIAESDEVSP